MRKLVLVLFAIAPAATLLAQQSRTEVSKATTPHDDAKPNSPTVPDVYAISGHFERVLVFRFKYRTDLLAGLERMVKDQKVRNSVILAGAGSVRNYYVHAVSNRTFPSRNVYVKDPSAPADILSMNGYIIDGRIHAHMTMAHAENAFGGHPEAGTEVFTFAIVTVGVFDDGVDLGRIDDKTYR
jgi:predicted DNA-binding protein with PD1-like motif